MYDRRIEGDELEFEASGALEGASLMMRDRQTDSWWSLMRSQAIGGALDGASVTELPLGMKSTWADWRARYPDTLVLSIDGIEHVDRNAYDAYFGDDGTFRDVEVEDDRLAPKAPVYAFWWKGEATTIAHATIEGGHVEHRDGLALVFHRDEGASVFASTRVAVVEAEAAGDRDAAAILRALDVEGFDSYWYTWILVNEGAALW